MTMEITDRTDGAIIGRRDREAAPSDDAGKNSSPFHYASRDEAMAIAEQMMERYEDVLRELAK